MLTKLILILSLVFVPIQVDFSSSLKEEMSIKPKILDTQKRTHTHTIPLYKVMTPIEVKQVPPKNLKDIKPKLDAQSILNDLINKYPILNGVKVIYGDSRGYQAGTYYTKGLIIINPNHTINLKTLITHEAWHIIDYRDNGRIDWGENIPR